MTPNMATPARAGEEASPEDQMTEDTNRPSPHQPAGTHEAIVTGGGSIRYRCRSCRREHWHGVADEEAGDITSRVSHCIAGDGETVLLRIVADERQEAAAG